MSARIEHVALWVRDIDAVAAFYARYLGARVGDLYRNERKGFESRFLAFESGARLEVMRRIDVIDAVAGEHLGFAHVAISVGSETDVDALAARLAADGWRVPGAPRRTGDGYYECVVLDPEGNRVELVAESVA